MDAPLLALTRPPLRTRRGEPSFAADSESMRQLIQLRWLAVLGQLATILLVEWGLGVDLPLPPMLAVIATAALLNVATAPSLRRRRVRHSELLLALMFDVGSLTLQLYLSGGATNPFISLYLLQVVLGAILLDRWASWIIVGVTGLSFALLVYDHRPLLFPPHLRPVVGRLQMVGGWLCFGLIATLLVLFVTRLIRNLRVRDARLADLRQQASEEDHLVRMGLFASGAAHELGTPLGTLSVILGDWRRVPKLAADPELMGEIAEMQAEVKRCKAIVTDVLHSVAELPESTPEPVNARRYLADTVAHWRALHGGAELTARVDLSPTLTLAADPALRQVIWNLLDNAAEASAGPIEMVARRDDDCVVVSVSDRGPGFSPALLAEFGKPRQSAKGSGHGVGLFLVASVVRRLGGTATAHNRVDGGAEVTISLPLGTIAIKE